MHVQMERQLCLYPRAIKPSLTTAANSRFKWQRDDPRTELCYVNCKRIRRNTIKQKIAATELLALVPPLQILDGALVKDQPLV